MTAATFVRAGNTGAVLARTTVPSTLQLPFFMKLSVPFTLALLRYALLLDSGEGSAPEDLVLHDRTMQVLGVLWMAVFAGGVYLGR